MEIDEKGRVNVSAKELLPKPEKVNKSEDSNHKNNETEENPNGEKRFFGKK